ncbi:alpha-D-ribose 1-methylphosphonate 5-triphosphate diphosphatase [Paroceanicella profunda]|uniref:Alpha-D-ribose 1-methylphosphonate 5-triphosphate diphosphatase n=1 Tax=Paroceanicella profunda TaxID=2579971 RepID=A0A5B8G0W4_9RHOB|nr:alpha-D-ribose 1-methylphosphonate 5-triphosphate diphosphatase [Paroceanicella profunda]QDL93654.1 alpha-D-ribose 1-methylphosphonate 5-triphosphate diphosphatase [Paroceanicella profunda]
MIASAPASAALAVGDAELANARLVLPDRVMLGRIAVSQGEIVEIAEGDAVPAGALDCGGDWLSPGLVELHTDNLERHMRPRPGVDWPHAAAILAHDAELAGIGITTVYDAIRVGSVLSGKKKSYGRYARQMANEILAARTSGALRISHFLHLRAEICSETLTEELSEFGPADRVGILSLMDHTPHQRQFADERQYRTYVQGKYGYTDAEFDAHVVHLLEVKRRFGAQHEADAVASARAWGAVLASHDDTTTDHVAASAAHGAGLAEFPTTLEAAEALRAAGIAVMMGAPNLLRGGSHSGNVAAQTLADAGLLDILSSDYAPASLLMGAVRLGREGGDMARGIRMVTEAPARASGLTDRGALAPGQRADLVRFATAEGFPFTKGVWVRGLRVA